MKRTVTLMERFKGMHVCTMAVSSLIAPFMHPAVISEANSCFPSLPALVLMATKTEAEKSTAGEAVPGNPFIGGIAQLQQFLEAAKFYKIDITAGGTSTLPITQKVDQIAQQAGIALIQPGQPTTSETATRPGQSAASSKDENGSAVAAPPLAMKKGDDGGISRSPTPVRDWGKAEKRRRSKSTRSDENK